MNNLIDKIHNVDCFEIMKLITDKSIDLILTDPPYMITQFSYDKKASKSLDLKLWFDEILRIAKDTAPIIIFASGKFTYKMINIGEKYFRYELVWDKLNKVTGALDANNKPLRNHEMILYFSKTMKKGENTYNHSVLSDKNVLICNKGRHTVHGDKKCFVYKKLNNKMYPRSILKFNKSNYINYNIHPSQKPYKLIEYLLLLYSNERDIVLDTFSGSGVTAQACILNNRQYISCELDKEFYDKSIKYLINDMFLSK